MQHEILEKNKSYLRKRQKKIEKDGRTRDAL